ncbi:MAG: hypothetical protein ABF868_08150 [Sporolactobacillus sp.]
MILTNVIGMRGMFVHSYCGVYELEDRPMFVSECSAQGVTVQLRAWFVGSDLLVVISGGDRPHLGALSACSQQMDTVTVSFPGHREQQLTERMAERLSKATAGHVIVIGGVHVDRITHAQIEAVTVLSDQLVDRLCAKMATSDLKGIKN